MNPDLIKPTYPPIYELVSLSNQYGALIPTSPAQLLTGDLDQVHIRSFGSISIAAEFDLDITSFEVEEICYRIIVFAGAGKQSIMSEYCHEFEESAVFDGARLFRRHYGRTRNPLVQQYRELKHMPRLPHSWKYIQFVH